MVGEAKVVQHAGDSSGLVEGREGEGEEGGA